jgi:hypothetical protein
VYRENTFWGLLFLVALLCLVVGWLLAAGKSRAAVIASLATLALTVETINCYLGAKVNAANASLHHAGFANVLHRTAPTLPYHVVFLVLVVLAALLAPAPRMTSPRRTKQAQEHLNA